MPKKRRLYYHDRQICLYHGDALEISRELQTGSADCIVTSPPYYGLRDYGTPGQYGLEKSPTEYVETMRTLFTELRRILADDGTLWLNIGDSYSRNLKKGGSGTPNGRNVADMGYPDKWKWREGSARADGQVRDDGNSRRNRDGCLNGDRSEKNLLGIPWRVAFALQDDGWILRNAIIWHKPNAMPESVTDRLSGRYEHVFMFSKSRRYWFNLDAIREATTNQPRVVDKTWTSDITTVSGLRGSGLGKGRAADHPLGRNPGDVWEISTRPFSAAHFAVMPIELAQRAILAGCKPGGTVLDPFSGSGTTGRAALNTKRRFIGIDINSDYLKLSLTHQHRFAKERDAV